jgi:hypothetical protein
MKPYAQDNRNEQPSSLKAMEVSLYSHDVLQAVGNVLNVAERTPLPAAQRAFVPVPSAALTEAAPAQEPVINPETIAQTVPLNAIDAARLATEQVFKNIGV